MMKKSNIVILLSAIIIIGSFINFYATNLLFSDLSNMYYGVHDAYIISSIPLFIIAVDFVTLFIFAIRFIRYPMYKKRLINLYTIFGVCNSVVGIVFTILTGTMIYKSFLAPYPFAGYSIIMLIVNVLLIALCVYINIMARKKIEEDKEKKHFKVKYILYSAVLGLLVYYAFNKFGAFLWAPFYIHYRTLYISFPFYLEILLPMGLLINIIVYFLNGYVGKEKNQIIVLGCIFFANILLTVAIIVIGSTNTQFISTISPALALERLATKPINIIFEFVVMFVLTAYYFVYSIITYNKNYQNDKENNE